MELGQLRAFVAVARHLHFTRAAEELHVAQPSLSQQIANLEAELGVRLFDRTRRRVVLTAPGQAFLPRARDVLTAVEEAFNEVQELSGLRRGSLAIGATPSVATHLLPEVLTSYRRAHPGIRLHVSEAGSRSLVHQLESGDLDLALVIMPVRERALETRVLMEEELVVATPRGHPLAERGRIALLDLRDEEFVYFRPGYDLRDVTESACRRAGFIPRVALEGGEMDSVLRFVAAGLGVAIVPAMVVDDQPICAIRLADPPLTRTVAVAHRRERSLSAAARVFLQHLSQWAAAADTPKQLESGSVAPRPGDTLPE